MLLPNAQYYFLPWSLTFEVGLILLGLVYLHINSYVKYLMPELFIIRNQSLEYDSEEDKRKTLEVK